MKTPIIQLAFRDCWPEVLEVIKRPEIQSLLDAGMADYDEQYPCGAPHRDRSRPWTYAHGDHWQEVAERTADLDGHWSEVWRELGFDSDDAFTEALAAEEEADQWPLTMLWSDRLDEIAARFLPRPDSVEWYQAFGCCHWWAEWQAAIGQVLMPDLDWEPVYGPQHSTAVGFAPYSNGTIPVVVFDLLREHEDPRDTLAEARRKRPLKKQRRLLSKDEKPTWPRVALLADAA